MMRIDAEQLVALAGIVKASAPQDPTVQDHSSDDPASVADPDTAEVKPEKRPQGRRTAGMYKYPDFSKALVTQMRRSPERAGLSRGAGGGAVGATLGALIARLVSKKPAAVGAGAAIGGLAGGVAGYHSGKGEAESDYSRLLFLRRRMGINEPGELEAMIRHPELANAFIRKGR